MNLKANKMTTRINALWNCKNPYQGEYKKILCVCSAGLLRSPSVAYYLSTLGYNTRAAGMFDYALIPVDDVLLEWADQIVTVSNELAEELKTMTKKEVINLEIPDRYRFRDPELMEIIAKTWEKYTLPKEPF